MARKGTIEHYREKLAQERELTKHMRDQRDEARAFAEQWRNERDDYAAEVETQRAEIRRMKRTFARAILAAIGADDD